MKKLSLWGYFLQCFKKYACFKGRARRREYWGFVLFYVIGLFIIDEVLSFVGDQVIAMTLLEVVIILTLLPHIAVSVRRLHDIGKSGWCLLIGFIPVIGEIYLLVQYCTDSDAFDDTYGPNPKEEE